MNLDPRGVEVRWTADLSDDLLKAVTREDPEPDEAMRGYAERAIFLEVDGTQVPLARTGFSARANVVEGHGRIVETTFRADVDLLGRHTVRVGNGTLSEAPCYFRDEVNLAPTAQLHDTNLIQRYAGREQSTERAWSRSERLRRVDLEVSFPEGPLHGLVRSWSTAPWRLEDAAITSVAAAWRRGRTDAQTLVLAAMLSAGVGIGAGAAGRSAWTFLAALVAFAAAWFVGIDSAAPWGVVLALGALIAVLDDAFGRYALPMTAVWVAASISGPLALVPGVAWLTGALLGTRLNRSVGIGLLAAASVFAVTRGGV